MLEIKEKQVVELHPRAPYNYFFEQEINEQPEAVLRSFSMGARLGSNEGEDCTKLGGLEAFREEMNQIENILIVASGSSLNAGSFGAHFFHKLDCFNTVQCFEASEFNEYCVPKIKAGSIFISQSGETADVFKALKIAKKKGMFTMCKFNIK